MTIVDLCKPSPDSLDLSMDRCSRFFPCLSDPARRSALALRASLVIIHVIYVGVLFLFDGELIEKTKREPWITFLYILLFLATLAQYFVTSSSSPGYVLDAVRAINESNAIHNRTPSVASKQTATIMYGTVVETIDSCRLACTEENLTSWGKLLTDLYPPGFSIRSMYCSYCNIEQPPRAKHCHDCDSCVLQFDHHCVWLGTCIGQGNHCKFWWYIFEETALCLWTGFLYITYLKTNIARAWWKAVIMIVLLVILSISLIFLLLLLAFHSYLALTNQTTFEIIRRRRILYLRGIPARVNPFSEGICRNIFNFCCARSSLHKLESLPLPQELDENARPYTCLDCITCRCC